jgi:exosortase/archaeosortase
VGSVIEEFGWFWGVVAWVLVTCAVLGAIALVLGLVLAVCSPSNW